MFQSLTSEMLVGGGLLCVSALVMAGGISMMRSRPEPKKIDIETALRQAPYHRLHNVLPTRGN